MRPIGYDIVLKKSLLLILMLLAGSAGAEEALLPANVAFRFTATAVDRNLIEVRFAIADGYYLYRERFAFAAETPEVTLGAPQLPAGEHKRDETFGEVEVYHNEVVARLPLQAPAGISRLRLKVTSQGCAEVGVCYPPQTRTIELGLGKRSS